MEYMERRQIYMFKMAEIKVEEIEVLDIITTSNEEIVPGENEGPIV